MDSNLAATSVNSLARSLRAFCTWLYEERYVDRDLFATVKIPKAPTLVKDTLSPGEVQALLETARTTGRYRLRDEAIILFLLDTGARNSEVCSLKAEDIDWVQGIAKLYGKGNKERFVPFSSITAQAMHRYHLRERVPDEEYFFQSERGEKLTTSGLYQISRRLSQASGVAFHPHKCRHTFGISYLRSGGSVFALQKTFGHTSLDTTMRYVAMVTEDLVREHQQHSPILALQNRRQPSRSRGRQRN
jgi:site-specific recombinase XerD